MNEQKKILFGLMVAFVLFGVPQDFFAQEEKDSVVIYRNQISINPILPVFGSYNLNYERTISKNLAIGVGGSIHRTFNDPSSPKSISEDFDTNYEINPFIRSYFKGAQKKSHFLEFFGALAGIDEIGSFVRSTTEEGFGVYDREINSFVLVGLGIGYGYRFLLLHDKMVIEIQLGVRRNFSRSSVVPNFELARGGLKVGYRF